MLADSVASAAFALITVGQDADGVARLTLARSAQRNAFNLAMASEIEQAMLILDESDVRVAILDAEGPAFCAGADMADIHNGTAALERIVAALTSTTVHLTAVVAGAARGGALAILAACPRVIALPTATFGLPELSRGFFPADVMDGQVSALGARRAFELAFRAGIIDAAEAKSIGIVTTVVDGADAGEYLRQESAILLGHNADALREGVQLWNARARTASSA